MKEKERKKIQSIQEGARHISSSIEEKREYREKDIIKEVIQEFFLNTA